MAERKRVYFSERIIEELQNLQFVLSSVRQLSLTNFLILFHYALKDNCNSYSLLLFRSSVLYLLCCTSSKWVSLKRLPDFVSRKKSQKRGTGGPTLRLAFGPEDASCWRWIWNVVVAKKPNVAPQLCLLWRPCFLFQTLQNLFLEVGLSVCPAGILSSCDISLMSKTPSKLLARWSFMISSSVRKANLCPQETLFSVSWSFWKIHVSSPGTPVHVDRYRFLQF